MPSAVISKYEYFSDRQVLRIVYVSGMIYDYLEVPPRIFEEFRRAFSKGKFLNAVIKKYYNAVRVETD